LVKEWRDGFWIAMNYSSTETYEAPVPENAKILVGSRRLKPADVVIWTELY
jgi:beta-galactosidase